MIGGITDSLNVVRAMIAPYSALVKTYRSFAYKKGEPAGVVGYKISKDFTNAFGSSDRTNYYVIHRRTFWTGWAAHCGLRSTPQNATGITISKEIYDDMDKDDSMNPELLVTNMNWINRFKRNDVVGFIKHHNTIVQNQNHGFMEAGFPIALRYKIVTV
jgi:hypothetical protein